VPALLACPYATAMATSEPDSALLLFRASAAVTIFAFAGAPVLIAPASFELFGPRNAGAIYRRLWPMVPTSNVVGTTFMSRYRDSSYKEQALLLSEHCDADAFAATFGDSKDHVAALIQSKTVTIPALLSIMPPDTVDPTPHLYDAAFYALAATSAAAFVCNVAAFRLPLPQSR